MFFENVNWKNQILLLWKLTAAYTWQLTELLFDVIGVNLPFVEHRLGLGSLFIPHIYLLHQGPMYLMTT